MELPEFFRDYFLVSGHCCRVAPAPRSAPGFSQSRYVTSCWVPLLFSAAPGGLLLGLAALMGCDAPPFPLLSPEQCPSFSWACSSWKGQPKACSIPSPLPRQPNPISHVPAGGRSPLDQLHRPSPASPELPVRTVRQDLRHRPLCQGTARAAGKPLPSL